MRSLQQMSTYSKRRHFAWLVKFLKPNVILMGKTNLVGVIHEMPKRLLLPLDQSERISCTTGWCHIYRLRCVCNSKTKTDASELEALMRITSSLYESLVIFVGISEFGNLVRCCQVFHWETLRTSLTQKQRAGHFSCLWKHQSTTKRMSYEHGGKYTFSWLVIPRKLFDRHHWIAIGGLRIAVDNYELFFSWKIYQFSQRLTQPSSKSAIWKPIPESSNMGPLYDVINLWQKLHQFYCPPWQREDSNDAFQPLPE